MVLTASEALHKLRYTDSNLIMAIGHSQQRQRDTITSQSDRKSGDASSSYLQDSRSESISVPFSICCCLKHFGTICVSYQRLCMFGRHFHLSCWHDFNFKRFIGTSNLICMCFTYLQEASKTASCIHVTIEFMGYNPGLV